MLKIHHFILVIIGLIIINCTSKKVDIDYKENVYKEFVQAVNTGDSIQVKAKIIKFWSDTLIGNKNRWLSTDLKYWLATNKEFGALKFISFGKDTFNNNKVAWFKGVLTKDWVGLEFDFNKNNKITGTNILRSCIPAKATLPNLNSQNLKDSISIYFKKLEAQDLFSGMVLIAKGDSIIYENTHGFLNKKNKIKLKINHKMAIASTTKMFTSVAIAQLVQQNKLDIKKPISNYLKDFPKNIGNIVTTAHLLTHTSGIELDEIHGFMKEIEQARSVDDFYKLNLKYIPKMTNYKNFAPLNNHDYSNENFDILGKLIEVLSNENYYSYLEKNIFKPLGMNNTHPIDRLQNDKNIANNYQIDRTLNGTYDDGFRNLVPVNLSYSRPAGSFSSTPKDLYSFMKAINENKLLDKNLKTLFVSKKIENLNIPIYKSWYGYGFYINKRYGFSNYGHAGGIPGLSSRCEYYPDFDTYVIIISNYNGAANLAANYISTLIPFIN